MTSPRHPPPLPRRQCLALGLLLAVALLWAQGLGLLHRAEHGGLAPVVAGKGAGHAPLQGLFDGHDEGSAECRLVDQLAHADVLAGGALGVAALPPSRADTPTCSSPLHRRHVAAYWARGPPGR